MSAKRTASRASDTASAKKAQWSAQAYTVEDLLKEFNLPQVVRCNPQAILIKKDSPLPVNLGQPVLLFESRTVRKLLARNVVFDTELGAFTESEETVVIPNDYEGDFLRLASRTTKDHTTYKIIGSLAQRGVKGFLNLSKFTAFQITDKQSNSYPKISYLPGNVFVVDGVFTGSARVKQESKFLNATQNSVQQLKYLKCRDEKNNEILIPLNQPGEFVEILANTLNGNGRLSVQSKDLIENQKFPIVVRYVRGKIQPRLTSFTGLLTLLDSYEETTIIGCMLDSKGYTLIELPLSSPLTFHLALNVHELFTHPIVKYAMRLCDQRGQSFAHDLKYKYKFAQRYMQLAGRKIPLDDSDDDPGDPPSARNSARFGVTTTYIYI